MPRQSAGQCSHQAHALCQSRAPRRRPYGGSGLCRTDWSDSSRDWPRCGARPVSSASSGRRQAWVWGIAHVHRSRRSGTQAPTARSADATVAGARRSGFGARRAANRSCNVDPTTRLLRRIPGIGPQHVTRIGITAMSPVRRRYIGLALLTAGHSTSLCIQAWIVSTVVCSTRTHFRLQTQGRSAADAAQGARRALLTLDRSTLWRRVGQ
jgi:hypothetical protein